MTVRLLLIGAAAFAVAGAASAQSAPAPGNSGNGPQGTPADLVVAASASTDLEPGDVEAVAEAQPAATPAKPRRAARVTSCRCGDTAQSGQ